MITKGLKWALDVLLNGVERQNEAVTFNDEQSAHNSHGFHLVVFRFCTFFEKDPNVITKWTSGADGVARVSKSVEVVYLGPSLPFPARFQNWDRHFFRKSHPQRLLTHYIRRCWLHIDSWKPSQWKVKERELEWENGGRKLKGSFGNFLFCVAGLYGFCLRRAFSVFSNVGYWGVHSCVFPLWTRKCHGRECPCDFCLESHAICC